MYDLAIMFFFCKNVHVHFQVVEFLQAPHIVHTSKNRQLSWNVNGTLLEAILKIII